MKRHFLSFLTAGLLVVILVLYLVFYQVRFNEIAVLTTFEKITSVKDAPGPYLKWPRPIQRVYRYDKRLQIYQSPLVQCVPVGKETIIVSVALGWRITNGEVFYREVYRKTRTTDYAKELLAGQVKSNLFIIEKHPLTDLISADEKDLQYDQIEEEMKVQLNRTFPTQYGVTVDFVRLVSLSFTEKVTKDYLDEQSEVLKRLADKKKSDAEKEAKLILEKANRERDQILVTAKGQAETIKSQGDAEAASHYSIFTQHSDLAIFLAQLKALEEIKSRTTVILDTRTPPYNLLEMKPKDLKLDIRESEPAKGEKKK